MSSREQPHEDFVIALAAFAEAFRARYPAVDLVVERSNVGNFWHFFHKNIRGHILSVQETTEEFVHSGDIWVSNTRSKASLLAGNMLSGRRGWTTAAGKARNQKDPIQWGKITYSVKQALKKYW